MLRAGHIIALSVLALLTIGVVMVNSANMAVQPIDPPGTSAAIASGQIAAIDLPEPKTGKGVSAQSILLSRSTMYMALAIVALTLAARLPLDRFSQFALRLTPRRHSDATKLFALGALFLIFIIALVYVPFIGREVNGSHRWIGLPIPGLKDALSVQPSEIAKWALIALIAWWGVARASVIHEFWRGLVPALVAIAAVAGFVVLEDLGTGVLIGATACLVLLAAGARVWQFALFVPAGVLALAAAIITSPYRVKRLTAFLDPYADAEGTGYHMIQSMTAVANGGGFGRGLGHGLQKFGYLPEGDTDFLFAVLCEELGIAGAAVVISLFLAILWAGIHIIRRQPDPLLKLIGLGVITTVGLQALINLAVVTGLGPTKGIALPLVSSGGTGWVLTAFSLGLLVAMDRIRVPRLSEPSLPSDCHSARPRGAMPQIVIARASAPVGTV